MEATRDSVSKLLESSEASTASGLQAALNELTQRYTAAQASQAEQETDLKGLLPRLENYERLGTDLQVFTQSRLKALSPAGQPDRAVDDYRQTIEVGSQHINSIFLLLLSVQVQRSCIFQHVVPHVLSQEIRSELEQEAGQLKSFCNLGTELSQSETFNNTQSLLENIKGVSDEFNQLEDSVNER